MKRLLILLPLLLVGCTNDNVAQVQELTQKICGFLPTFTTISAILANPGVSGAEAVAKAICSAVKANPPETLYQADPFVDKSTCPQVNGVCIDGDFVGKDEK